MNSKEAALRFCRVSYVKKERWKTDIWGHSLNLPVPTKTTRHPPAVSPFMARVFLCNSVSRKTFSLPAPVPGPAQQTLDVVIWPEPPSTCFPILSIEQVFLFSQGWICELCAQDTIRWVWQHKASQSEVSKSQSSLETKQENILSQYKCKKSPLLGLAQLHNAIGEQSFLGPSPAAQSSPSHIPLPREASLNRTVYF